MGRPAVRGYGADWKEAMRLYARLPVFARRVAAAQERVRSALDVMDSPYIACSFGKESVCVAHLVQDVFHAVPIVSLNNGFTHLPCDEACIQEWVKRQEANLQYVRWSKDEYLATKSDPFAGSDHGGLLTAMRGWIDAQSPTPDGVFMGLRAQESKARKRTAGRQGWLHRYDEHGHSINAGAWRCLPIYDWNVEDVWAYILHHDLPILDIYEKMGMETRSGLFGWTNAQNGRLVYLRHYYPELWNAIVARYPEASYYT